MPQTARNPGYAGQTVRVGFFDTTRVGYIYRQDETERVVKVLARTCHLHFSSLKLGGGTSAREALDYTFREGEYAKADETKLEKLRRELDDAREAGDAEEISRCGKAVEGVEEQNSKADELECTAGDRELVEDACARIEASARVRRGRTAERFLIEQVIELPGDSTPEQRKACAEALVRHWESRGHPACAAVHGNGRVQPHVHVQATSRPVSGDGTVDRSVLLWTSKQELRDEREAVVEIVNRECPSTVRFHGGRHDDVHIDREARREAGLLQRRLPRRARYRPGKYDLDDEMPGRVKEMHERGRAWARAEAAANKAEKERKAVAREALRAAREAAGKIRENNREVRRKRRERRDAEQAELRELSEKQSKWIEDAHRDGGRELPDLDSEEGRRDAWAFTREQAERKQAESREKEAAAEAAGRSQAEEETGKQRTLDELRAQWTRERQAREKFADRRRRMAARHWSSGEEMIATYKHVYDQEQDLIEVIDRKSYVSDEDRRWRAEAEAVHDLLFEFAGKKGVDFGHGVAEPAWRLGRDAFLEQARTVAQDGNGDRVHVAFPRVAGAPELVADRKRQRWDYRHPDPEQSHRTGKAVDWESAAGMAHHASVRDALKRADPVPTKALADYPDLRERRAKVLREEYRRVGLTRRNALRDSKDMRASDEFREEAAGRLERTEARIAEMREEAKALGVELEPRRREDRSQERGGGMGD